MNLKKNRLDKLNGKSKRTFKLPKEGSPLAIISKSGTLALNVHLMQNRKHSAATINVRTVYFFFENCFNHADEL